MFYLIIFVEGLGRFDHLLKAVAKPVALYFSLASFKISTMEQEIWKDIPGWESYYQASSHGRIKSLDRCVKVVRKGIHYGQLRFVKGQLIKQQILKERGYYRISLMRDHVKVSYATHVLIAMAFHNYKPNGKQDLVVDHDDNIKSNNYASNLKIITQRENSSKDRWRHNYTSKHVGVHYDKARNKWVAKIRDYDNTPVFIGRFENEEEARDKYLYFLEKVKNGEKIRRKKRIKSSKYAGVTLDKRNKRWISRISINNKQIHLGCFDREEDAANAYVLYKAKIN